MDLIAYTGAILMGIVLGLVGAGGSILTLPILVYLLKIHPSQATGYSLFIVGITSLFGSWDYIRRKHFDFKTCVVFSMPAFIGVYISRIFIMPNVPDPIFSLGSFHLGKGNFIMAFFAGIMLLASYSMIKKNAFIDSNGLSNHKKYYLFIALEGSIIGLITGFVGAGGGFLIIPALVVLAGLEMKTAVGTSLMIISIKSLLGFIGDVQTSDFIDWHLLGIFSCFSVAGILFGAYLSRHIPEEKLLGAFGWFVFVMAFAMLAKEFLA